MDPLSLRPAPTLKDWVPVRSLSAADRPALIEHLLALHEQDRYLRFGHTIGEEQIRDYVAGIDFADGEVLGIFNRRLELLGMSHLADLGPEEAEFGVSVLPKARGRGFGQLLFEHACLHARARGVKVLVIHSLAENEAMLSIARHAGAQIIRESGEATARLALPPIDIGTRWMSLLDDQVAEFDFQIKAGRLKLQEILLALEGAAAPDRAQLASEHEGQHEGLHEALHEGLHQGPHERTHEGPHEGINESLNKGRPQESHPQTTPHEHART